MIRPAGQILLASALGTVLLAGAAALALRHAGAQPRDGVDITAAGPICSGSKARTARTPQTQAVAAGSATQSLRSAAGFDGRATPVNMTGPGFGEQGGGEPRAADEPGFPQPGGHDGHLARHDHAAMPMPAAAAMPVMPAMSAMPRPEADAKAARKILYYRHPMGLADVSPVPKKDSMGMDYVPVYDDEAKPGTGGAVQIAPGRLQRGGVRTEVLAKRRMHVEIRGSGTIGYDDRLLTSVVAGVEGFADEVYVGHVGQQVRKGESLFRISSNNSQLLQIEIARRNRLLNRSDGSGQNLFAGSVNLTAADWPSPATGVVVEKRLVNGQRVPLGEELFRIADVSRMWVVTDVAESDLALLQAGMKATVKPRAFPGEAIDGRVVFVYPALNGQTRTARVCVEVQNPDSRLRAEMYADVVLHADVGSGPVVSAPASAIIDDGREQHVLVALGEGRFEPRTVRTGARAGGYVEVLDGLAAGDSVVTSAASLIDADSRLQAVLAAFAAPGNP